MSYTLTAEQVEALSKKLQKIAGTILNLPDGEIASLAFNEDGEANENFESVLTTKFKTHINSVRDGAATNFDDGYKKAQSEVLSKLEREFNTTFEYDGEGKLLDRVKTVLDLRIKKAIEGVEGKELTDVEVENHPKYKTISQALIDQKTGFDEELNSLNKTFESAQMKSQVKTLLENMVDELNPVFNKDTVKAKNQRADLIDNLANENWKIENKVLIPTNEDGTVRKNEMLHPIVGNEVVKGIVTRSYDLNASGPNPPAGGGGSQGGGTSGFKDIDTSQKFAKKLAELSENERKASRITDKDERERQIQLATKATEDLLAHGEKLNF